MRNKGALYLIITVIFVSTFEVVSRTLKGVIDPIQVTFLRFFFGGLVLLPLAIKDLKNQKIRLGLKELGTLFLLGVINVGVSMTLLQYGINLTSASLAAVIFSSNPLFVALFAALLLGEPLTWQKLSGMVLGFSGVVITSTGGGAHGIGYCVGVLLLVLSAVAFGIYTVAAKKSALHTGSLVMNSFSFIFGSIVLLPLLQWLHLPVFAFDPRIWPQLAYISVCVTGIAYYTYFIGLSMTDTSLGSMVFFAKPVLASLLAAAALGEQLSWNLGTGILLILVSTYLVQQAVKSKAVGKRDQGWIPVRYRDS